MQTRSRPMWPVAVVFSWRWLFYSTALGVLVGGLLLAFPRSYVEGEAIASGMVMGLACWLGYPLGLWVASWLLRPVHRLLHMTQSKIDWVISEYQIPMPESSDADRPSAVVRLVTPALYLYWLATVPTTIVLLQAGLFQMAGLSPAWEILASMGGTAIAAYAYIFGVALWFRGRTQLLAYAYELERGRQKVGRVAFKLNHMLRLA